MSFREREPPPRRNLCIRNKTYKAPTTATTPLRTPGADSQNAQVNPLLELAVPVKEDRVSCQASGHMHNSSISVDSGRLVT